jgi:hypothetical protein
MLIGTRCLLFLAALDTRKANWDRFTPGPRQRNKTKRIGLWAVCRQTGSNLSWLGISNAKSACRKSSSRLASVVDGLRANRK